MSAHSLDLVASRAPPAGSIDERVRNRGEGEDQLRWHGIPVQRSLDLLASSPSGLTQEEAERRQRIHGLNQLPQARGPSFVRLFLRQFRSPLIYLLLAATGISLALGHLTDAGFIAVVLILNAVIGTVQERRAEASMSALATLIRHSARVRRDGAVREVDAAEVVPGDVAELESGMAVPADIRLLSSSGLLADESLLSGESMPAAKDAGAIVDVSASLADRPTMLHAGTTISEGRGTGCVVATGLTTELGRIQASLNRSASAPPPLVLRLQTLSRQIALAALALIAVLALLLGLQGEPAAEILLLAVALAVSAIPEGLPIAVTVALAAATRRMAARNVIVRTLPAVEGLGSCTLIASDKTGTLTMNRLSVERVLLADGRLLTPDTLTAADPALRALVEAAAYCNDATAAPGGMLVGDTVDIALAEFSRAAGMDILEARSAGRAAQLPYEPANRFAAVVIRQPAGPVVYIKGAPEAVLPMCETIPEALVAQAEELAGEGYRLLALASRSIREAEMPDCRGARGLGLLGWVALLDPLRPEAPAAIRRCAEAGISVRMVTGDHPATARTIAAQLGLACSPDQVVTGWEMSALAHDLNRLADLVRGGRVFARIDPGQKLRIVEILSASGHVVAVTGDGVNDAPALQAADIGVAMGQAGTDVARGAADLVLADDNFASIVGGIEEGRITYANVRKIVIFLLATGIAEIAMFLGAVATGLPMPLTALQLLWLNLVTNGAQDVMLGFGRGEGDELKRPPRRPGERIVDRTAIALMVPPALAMAGMAVLMMQWGDTRAVPAEEIQNAVLLLVVLFQNAYVLCMRSERRPLWRVPLMANPWLLIGVALALGLQLLAMHWAPLQDILGTGPVDPLVLGFCLAGAAITVIVTEATKWAVRRNQALTAAGALRA